MRKILLDLGIPDTKEKTLEYIAEQMGFEKNCGKSLDALYDELVSIDEPTAIGIFMPMGDMIDLDFDLMVYLDKVCETFSDAEESNTELAVIFGDITANPGYEDEYDDMLNPYIDDYTGERIGGFTDDSDFDDDAEFDEFGGDMPGDKDILMIDLDRIGR